MTIGGWTMSRWIPRRPSLHDIKTVWPLLHFGATITANSLVIYVAYNLDKMLLGRYFGIDALGLYSRASQLISLPTQNLNGTLGTVAFATLSRVQDNALRFKNYFLKSYSVIVSITIPITFFSFIECDDIIRTVLGSKWTDATPIFQSLVPTIFVFGVIDPLGWLMQSIGLQKRSLHVALTIAPLVIMAYLIGLPYGPVGVALAYSTAMILFMVPCVLWCLRGTPITPLELFMVVARTSASASAGVLAALAIEPVLHGISHGVVRLGILGAVFLFAYAFVLLFVMNQRALYADLARNLMNPARATG
jgi:O-antigen/teichoic acid export membrane protein